MYKYTMYKFLIVVIGITYVVANDRPIVTTSYGEVKGTYLKSYDGRKFSSFQGIPYAKPPIGNLRFEDPQPAEPWIGIWDANITSTCVQIMHSSEPEGGYFEGEEDCLHINIFVPDIKASKDKVLDVIVHIHGGAFMFGGASTYSGPRYLMDKDVVFVTFNYRLGPFGFLSTEDGIVPGNAGMKDQVQALKWIKENIRAFGGNPNSITITGLSAGGASVHFHFLSPLSKDLFHKGISTSGTSLCPWTMQEDALSKAKKLADLVGCHQENVLTMISCMKQRSARQITEAIKAFRPWLINPFSPFGVVVDKGSSMPFLPAHPYEILSTGKAHDLPWITSVTSDEGLYPGGDFVIKENYLPYLDKHWEELAPHILDYNYTVSFELKDKISKTIREYYLQDRIISRKTFNEVIQILGDRLFVVDAEKAARLQAAVNKAPVYFYYFSYHGEEMASLSSLITHYESKYGISHGDDMMYIFSIDTLPLKMSTQDKHMKDLLVDMWVSFAKTGKPFIKNTSWDPVDKNKNNKLKYVHIASPKNVILKEIQEMGHRSFWDTIPFQENENMFKRSTKLEL